MRRLNLERCYIGDGRLQRHHWAPPSMEEAAKDERLQAKFDSLCSRPFLSRGKPARPHRKTLLELRYLLPVRQYISPSPIPPIHDSALLPPRMFTLPHPAFPFFNRSPAAITFSHTVSRESVIRHTILIRRHNSGSCSVCTHLGMERLSCKPRASAQVIEIVCDSDGVFEADHLGASHPLPHFLKLSHSLCLSPSSSLFERSGSKATKERGCGPLARIGYHRQRSISLLPCPDRD